CSSRPVVTSYRASRIPPERSSWRAVTLSPPGSLWVWTVTPGNLTMSRPGPSGVDPAGTFSVHSAPLGGPPGGGPLQAPLKGIARDGRHFIARKRRDRLDIHAGSSIA